MRPRTPPRPSSGCTTRRRKVADEGRRSPCRPSPARSGRPRRPASVTRTTASSTTSCGRTREPGRSRLAVAKLLPAEDIGATNGESERRCLAGERIPRGRGATGWGQAVVGRPRPGGRRSDRPEPGLPQDHRRVSRAPGSRRRGAGGAGHPAPTPVGASTLAREHGCRPWGGDPRTAEWRRSPRHRRSETLASDRDRAGVRRPAWLHRRGRTSTAPYRGINVDVTRAKPGRAYGVGGRAANRSDGHPMTERTDEPVRVGGDELSGSPFGHPMTEWTKEHGSACRGPG